MNNPFDFFEEIYCINLKSRPEKWESSLLEFSKVGIQDRVKRFDAIQHKNGAVGCARSHISLIQYAKNNNLENICITEDDIQFEPNCLEVLEASISQLPEKFDLFHLGINPLNQMTRCSENLVNLSGGGYTTHCYSIHHSFYDTILNTHSTPIDVFYSQLHRKLNNSYCTYPMIALQRDGYSDIENVQCDNGNHIRKRFYQYVK